LLNILCVSAGEHQYEILDFVAAKFHEELGVFKLLVCYASFYIIIAHVIYSHPILVLDYWMFNTG